MNDYKGMKKVFVGGNVMSGKTIPRYLLDGHPKMLCNHLHDLLGMFIISDESKTIFLRKRLQSYLSIQNNLPCVNIKYKTGETASVDIGDFFWCMRRFGNYRVLHKFAEGKIIYVAAKETFHETVPFSFNLQGFEEMLKELLFSTNRVFSPEEVIDAVYLSYEKSWINKQYHEGDYWFVNTLANGIDPILNIINNLPEAKVIVMDRDPLALCFSNAIRTRSYANAGNKIDNDFRKVLFDQKEFINKIKKFRNGLFELDNNCKNLFIVDFNQLIFNTEIMLKEMAGFLEIEYDEILSKPSLCGGILDNTKYPIIGEINDDPYKFLKQNDIDLLQYFILGFNKQYSILKNASIFLQAVKWRYLTMLIRKIALLFKRVAGERIFLRLKKIYQKI
jgi:hypothetical protein